VSVRILRKPEVIARTGLSASSLERLERRGEFPPRRRLGPNAVGWLLDEIEAWVQGRPPAILPSQHGGGPQ